MRTRILSSPMLSAAICNHDSMRIKMCMTYDYQRIRNHKRKIELLDIMEAKHRVRRDNKE